MELQVDTRWQAKELYRLHAEALVGFAASIVGSSDAEDVVASVAGRIFRSAAFEAADNQKAYLYQAVLNAARSHLRSTSRRKRREERVALDRTQSVEGAHSTDREVSGPDLSGALDALSPRQRAVIHLTYWEELTGPEVSKRLGISEGSVRKHLARAKDALRETING